MKDTAKRMKRQVLDWGGYLQITDPVKDVQTEYKKNS